MTRATILDKSVHIGVGIDFGTSNSAVAWYDGNRLQLVQLEDTGIVMPTATHLDREFATTTGEDAVQRYIEENRDRIVELTPEIIGYSSLLVSDSNPEDSNSGVETIDQAVYGQPIHDRQMPGRLFRGVKRLLGQASIKRLMVFNRPFRLVALITPVLKRLREALEESIGRNAASYHVGHPVNFEGRDEFHNQLALDRLGEAYHYAGYESINFYPEPLAAMLSYFNDEPHGERGVVLTFDFGGGTLDLSLVRFQEETFEVLATDGLPLGGDHIDQLIYREVLFPQLGRGAIWKRKVDGQMIESLFPFEDFEDCLLNWAVTYTLNQGKFRSKIADCIAAGGESAACFERLDDLITHNYGYVVFQAIRRAKAELSTLNTTCIDIPELDLELPIDLELLNRMLASMLDEIQQLINRILSTAGLGFDDVDLVIRTGGSSQIVAVREILERCFPCRVTEHDPFTSVAAGLAIANFYTLKFDRQVN